MRKTVDDFAALDLFRRGQRLCQRDDGGEVLLAVRVGLDVCAAGESRRAGGENPRANLLALGRYDAVGGEENRAFERFKLGELFPPGVAVVADEVGSISPWV